MDDASQPLSSELAAHGAWARRLARALTRDATRAEDAAQEAWLAAAERRRAGLAVPRTWLGSVVRNAVRGRGRAEARRRRHERAGAHAEALPSSVELAHEAELQRDLVDALLALDEPYRSTLVLRFYRDLSAAEIAHRQDVSEGTVRSRVHRALEALRARLDARYGDRSAWSAALAPLAAGGVVMGIQTKLSIAGAFVLVGLGWLAFRETSHAPPEELGGLDASPTAVLVEAAEQEPNAPLVEGASGAGARTPVATAEPDEAAPAPPVLRARVVDPDGNGVVGATVELLPSGRSEPTLARAIADAHGRVTFTLDDELQEQARAALGDGVAQLAWRAPELRGGSLAVTTLDSEHTLPTGWAATVTGSARDAVTGAALEDVELDLDGIPARSGAGGTFRIAGAPVGYETTLEARRAGYAKRRVGVLIRERGEHRVDVELTPADAFRVRVVDRATRDPLPGAILAEYAGGPPLTTTDEQGVAVIDARVGSELTLCAEADGFVPVFWSWVVDAQPSSEEPVATFPLRRASFAACTVLDEDGAPLAGAWVYADCKGHSFLMPFDEEEREATGLIGYSGDLPGKDRFREEQPSNPEGLMHAPLCTCGAPVFLTASHPHHPSTGLGPLNPPEAGGTIRAAIRLGGGGGVTGRATRNGAPWHAGEVLAFGAKSGALARAAIGPEGGFEFAGLPAGPVRLELRAHLGRLALATAEVEVEPGRTVRRDVDWVVELATISGRVRDPRGAPRAGVFVRAGTRDRTVSPRMQTVKTDLEGRFVIEVQPGARYEVSTWNESVGEDRRREVAAGAEDLELVLPDVGTLRLRVVDARTGEPPSSLTAHHDGITWSRAGQGRYRKSDAAPDVDGLAVFPVEAGAVDVAVHFAEDGYLPARLSNVRVAADGEGGASQPVLVRLERGVEVRLRFAAGCAEALRGRLLFILDEDELARVEGPFPAGDPRVNHTIDGLGVRVADPLLLERRVTVESAGVQVVRGLRPGRYRLRVLPDDVMLEPGAFDVVEGAEIEVALPR